MAPQFDFVPLLPSDFGRLAMWLSRPHVQPWFYERAVDEAFVAEHYGSVAAKTTSKCGFVIAVDGIEIGYIETYRGEDHEDFFRALEVSPSGVAGVDILIGEPALLGRHVGSSAIATFTADVVFLQREVERAVAAPQARNLRSVGAFRRAGYAVIAELDVPGDDFPVAVMQCERPAQA
jgi:aminoglycoside 6'-N-acetyltransferase